jgi:hypothetical protein
MNFLSSLLPDIFSNLCMEQFAPARSMGAEKAGGSNARPAFETIFDDACRTNPRPAARRPAPLQMECLETKRPPLEKMPSPEQSKADKNGEDPKPSCGALFGPHSGG